MNILPEHFRGSILLETLIAIVILGLIVTGSLYSYSFVYQTIRSQRQQKIALSMLQGWMERAISSFHESGFIDKERLIEEFESQIEDFFISDTQNIEAYIDTNNKNGMTTLKIGINLDGLPISLYTELYTGINPSH